MIFLIYPESPTNEAPNNLFYSPATAIQRISIWQPLAPARQCPDLMVCSRSNNLHTLSPKQRLSPGHVQRRGHQQYTPNALPRQNIRSEIGILGGVSAALLQHHRGIGHTKRTYETAHRLSRRNGTELRIVPAT